MSPAALTRHALTRMSQRGFHGEDIDLIRMIGTEVEDGYMVLNRDRLEAERILKSLLQKIQRLGGKRIVVAGEQVVTMYRAKGATELRLLRHGEERQLSR